MHVHIKGSRGATFYKVSVLNKNGGIYTEALEVIVPLLAMILHYHTIKFTPFWREYQVNTLNCSALNIAHCFIHSSKSPAKWGSVQNMIFSLIGNFPNFNQAILLVIYLL